MQTIYLSNCKIKALTATFELKLVGAAHLEQRRVIYPNGPAFLTLVRTLVIPNGLAVLSLAVPAFAAFVISYRTTAC